MSRSKRPAASSADALVRMQSQKRRDTNPEIIVRSVLEDLGHKYRVGRKSLPGSPDIANAARKWAIFVHGCYWHQHPGCSRATMPKNNRDWWLEKFDSNRRRDARKIEELEQLGFEVVVVWECETRDADELRASLALRLPPARRSLSADTDTERSRSRVDTSARSHERRYVAEHVEFLARAADRPRRK